MAKWAGFDIPLLQLHLSISLIAYWIHETEAFRLSFGRMLHVPRVTYSANERISAF